MPVGKRSAQHLQGCIRPGARGRRVVVAPRLLSTVKEDPSGNHARIEEVLQKKLRKRKVLSKGSGYREPQDTLGAHSDRARAQEPPEKAGDDLRRLGADELLAFERHGHLTTRGVLSEAQVLTVRRPAEQAIKERSNEALQQRIRVLLPSHHRITVASKQQALHHLKTHRQELGFLQHFNLHRYDKDIRSLVLDSSLVSIAAQLLNSRNLRLYQDCIFLKHPGFSETHWHSDCPLSPLDTSAFVTAWIPLRPIQGKADSGLRFAQGSHRDISAHFHGRSREQDLSRRGYSVSSVGRMDLGDVSWHHGWLLHHAPAQPAASPARLALAVSYFVDGARVIEQQCEDDREDRESYDAWCGAGPGKLTPGQIARHALLPLVQCQQCPPRCLLDDLGR